MSDILSGNFVRKSGDSMNGQLTMQDNINIAAGKTIDGRDLSTTALLASGTYTGNSVDNRAITGVGFAPDLVIVYHFGGTYEPYFKVKDMTGNYSHSFGSAWDELDIKTLDSDGFTLGNGAGVNGSTLEYGWIAVKF